jgi:hypothetical protein
MTPRKNLNETLNKSNVSRSTAHKPVRYPVAQQVIDASYALDLTDSHFRFEALEFMDVEGPGGQLIKGLGWWGFVICMRLYHLDTFTLTFTEKPLALALDFHNVLSRVRYLTITVIACAGTSDICAVTTDPPAFLPQPQARDKKWYQCSGCLGEVAHHHYLTLFS